MHVEKFTPTMREESILLRPNYCTSLFLCTEMYNVSTKGEKNLHTCNLGLRDSTEALVTWPRFVPCC